jgi:Domain of Unknown Function (DUF1259)
MCDVQRRFVLIAVLLFVFPAVVVGQGLDTAKIDQALGRSGQQSGGVYRVSFPRSDLHVSVEGLEIKAGLALGSWAAFSGTNDDATVMGDLVLLQSEVNPVMEKLRSAGFEITAVHNHLLNETPRVMYMHYMGHGNVAQLASSLRAALAVSGTPLGKPPAAPAEPPTAPPWVQVVEGAIKHKGVFKDGVLSFGVPRAGTISMNTMPIAPSQGVAESINFQEAGPGKLATTGDFVLTAQEVNPMISALGEHHIEVTALHSHMLEEQPRLFFMHFWGVASPQTLAAGIEAALSDVSTK